MSEDIQEVLMIIVKALSVFLVGLLVFSVFALELSKKPPEERARLRNEMLNRNAAGANLPDPWPPKMNAIYPDMALVDQDGVAFNLSDLKGRIIVMELVDMASPLSQAYAGARTKGVYGAQDQKIDAFAQPFSVEAARHTESKVQVPNADLVMVSLIVKDGQGESPDAQDAQDWATHFGLEKGRYHVVAVSTKDLRSRQSDTITPGFQLIDRNFLLRVDSAGPTPKHNLTLTLIPLMEKLLHFKR